MSPSDIRESQLRELHRDAKKAEQDAARKRKQRDQLVRRLRREDPVYYTHARLAAIVRCSPELIAHILRQRS